MKSGFVAIVGRPNVGKSTLINKILNHKIAIVTNKPQTTRNNIQGIYNEEQTQIIFVDTPGIHKPKHKLGQHLNKQAYQTIKDVDIILMMIDAKMGLGKGDQYIIECLKNLKKPVFLIINKIDKIKKEQILPIIDKYQQLYDFTEIIPLSALKGENIKSLIATLKQYLPDKIKYYPDNQLTNQTEQFQIAEIIREKVFMLTEEEIPHSTICIIEEIIKDKDKYVVRADIVVERSSLKKIIIGKNGVKIKEIGTQARKELEIMLNKKVYLELFVKVIKKWRQKEKFFQ